MEIELSIIIVTYQNIEIVRDCLDSIKKHNDIGNDLEVIISDNSEDDLLANTIQAEFDWVKVIKNENKGFGAGNNRGFEISSGKYILFLNPDTILVEPIFKFAIEQFEKNISLGLFGVQLCKKNLKKNSSFFFMDRYSILSIIKMKFCRAFNIFVDGKMFISGADLFVRRETFEEAGKFDENIFMYKEEADLIKRIKLCAPSKKTAFFKQKKIIHLEGGTEEGNNQSLSQLERMWQSDLYYSKKWDQDIVGIYVQRKMYQKLKYVIYKVLLKRNKAQNAKKILSFYNEKLLELKS